MVDQRPSSVQVLRLEDTSHGAFVVDECVDHRR